MVYTGQIPARQRLLASGGALFVAVGIGLGLASGFDLPVLRTASEAISAIALPAPPSNQETVPDRTPRERPSGKASAANEYAKAAPVVAPPPRLPPPKPPEVVAASTPGSGADASAGATPTPGPGSGAGGHGNGTGAGGSGSGTGGGSKAIWQSGVIRDRDYPKTASRANIGGEVEVRFTIEPTGRVTRCRVTRSSGDASLDTTTCRLIEERFRFRPATNSAGEPVASSYGWRQRWWLESKR